MRCIRIENEKNAGFHIVVWAPLVNARLEGILFSGICLWVKKCYQLMTNLKEAVFAEFRTEDTVLQCFLITVIQYLQFVKFEVEKASRSNMDLDERVVVRRRICLYML